MITFYLVRHGKKEKNPFDPPLTDVGLHQAQTTAKFLQNISFNEIVASPKLRTKQTAEAIAKPHSLTMSEDSRLLERLEWENEESFDEFIAEWRKTDLDRKHAPKKGNSSVDKGILMRKVLDELSAKHAEGNVLIVTHGGAIGDLLRNLFGEENLPHIIDPITNAPHIKIFECSITKIEKDNDGYKLVQISDVSHLS